MIEATITERSRTDYGTSVPSQLLVIKLLADYDSVVRQRRKALKSSAARFADFMSKHLPDWKWQTPSGGLSAWIDTGTDSEILATQSLRHRVAVATGVSASRSPSARTHIRVCFDRPPVELEAAVVRLARAADDTRGVPRLAQLSPIRALTTRGCLDLPSVPEPPRRSLGTVVQKARHCQQLVDSPLW